MAVAGIFDRGPRTWLWSGALLLAFFLSGDRLGLSRSRPDRLRFVHTFTAESERAIIDAAVAEFERTHPGLRIEQVVYNSDTYQTLGWRLQFQGTRPADIYFAWQGFRVEQTIANRWALDLTPWLPPEFVAEFVPSALRRQQGGIYLLPHSVDISNLVWFNRDMFTQLGAREPATLDEWEQLCVALRRAGRLPLGQVNRDLWPMGNFGSELMGQTLGADGLARLFRGDVSARPEDFRGLGTFDFLRRNGGFDLPGVLNRDAIGSLGDIDAKVLFLGGKSAQHVVGSWFLADLADAREKKELRFEPGVFAIPARTGETDAMTVVTTGYQVNPATRHPRGAAEFLQLLLSRKYQSQFAAIGALSARRDAAAFTADPLARRMLTILAAAPVLVPPPDTGYRPEQAAVFYELCAKLLTGKLELAQAADFWQREKSALARKGL